jgi:hypothetical protein
MLITLLIIMAIIPVISVVFFFIIRLIRRRYDAVQDQYFGGINISIGGARAPGNLIGTNGGLLTPESDTNR